MSTHPLTPPGTDSKESFLQPHFTMVNLAALYHSNFALGYSNNERQAVARALLRYNSHMDRIHYQTQLPQGLHPAYVEFNLSPTKDKEMVLSKCDLVEASLGDVFDAIAMQEWLDGRISILLRCPGGQVPSGLACEKVPIDVYITPRELHEDHAAVGGDVAVTVQAFSQEFVVPHLQRFIKCCCLESVKPLKIQRCKPFLFRATLKLINLSTSPCKPSQSKGHSRPFGGFWLLHSAVGTKATPKRAQTPAKNRPWFADAFERPPKPNGEDPSGQSLALTEDHYKILPLLVSINAHSDAIPPLVSIGAHLDAILDEFKLENSILPHSHKLITHVHSSRWEKELTSSGWNLSPQQGARLAQALLLNIHGKQNYTAATIAKKPIFAVSVFLQILQGLGILALLFMLKITWFVLGQPASDSE
ncbi:hypothetical protein JVT61DRAFT_15479 [Boletus reticuloceps]|uniref:Uncharacterized protein n=1 Tax=Boletus reticuloceps TaxID=495285 RepID=A0A8I2YCD0_9AGAM|nr:hypothetical protein JVT61DRAFT_15479 [Boletus reticuloceps]